MSSVTLRRRMFMLVCSFLCLLRKFSKSPWTVCKKVLTSAKLDLIRFSMLSILELIMLANSPRSNAAFFDVKLNLYRRILQTLITYSWLSSKSLSLTAILKSELIRSISLNVFSSTTAAGS